MGRGAPPCLLSLSALCPQVNLKTGVPPDSNNETCTAGAGSLLVEFGILSRLLGDSTFEWVARRAVKALWSLRSNDTGLLGTGPWASAPAAGARPWPSVQLPAPGTFGPGGSQSGRGRSRGLRSGQGN